VCDSRHALGVGAKMGVRDGYLGRRSISLALSLDSFVTKAKGREGLSQLGGMLFARACSGTVLPIRTPRRSHAPSLAPPFHRVVAFHGCSVHPSLFALRVPRAALCDDVLFMASIC
jgi:hypothetical protein